MPVGDTMNEGARPQLSCVVPSLDGLELLSQYLPSLVHALVRTRTSHETIVIDDGSRDGTFRFMGDRYPEVRVLRNSQSEGFTAACTRGVREARGELVLLLNNDMEVHEDCICYLLEAL